MDMQTSRQQASETRRGTWFVLAAAVLFGASGTAQALAPAGVQPAVIGAGRLAVGALWGRSCVVA